MRRSTKSKPAPRSNPAATSVPARLGEGLAATEHALIAGLAHDADLARDAALRAPDFSRLAVVQFEWAAEQWARGAQAWTGLLSALFDAQATFWRDAEAGGRACLEPWLAPMRRPVSIEGALESPEDLSPHALMQRAAAVWTLLGQTCINALEHDLVEDRAARH
jgi:hypothetical protein